MIYSLIYGPRPPIWNLPGLLLWYLFGNWEDGWCGWMTPKNWRTAVKWWVRNPFHNLLFHIFPFYAPLWWKLVLLGVPENPAIPFWPKDYGLIIALTPFPLVCAQFPLMGSRWQFYLGWRILRQYQVKGLQERDLTKSRLVGVFGLALRKG